MVLSNCAIDAVSIYPTYRTPFDLIFQRAKLRRTASRARFELATLRLMADLVKNLSALSRVPYKKPGAILTSSAAPCRTPKPYLRNLRSRMVFSSVSAEAS